MTKKQNNFLRNDFEDSSLGAKEVDIKRTFLLCKLFNEWMNFCIIKDLIFDTIQTETKVTPKERQKTQ